VGGFEHAGKKLTIVLEFSFDVNIGKAAVPQNFDVKSGGTTSGWNFHFIVSVSRSRSLTHSPSAGLLLGKGTARRRDLSLTTHNTHKRQTYVSQARFEPTNPTSERPQTHALE